MMCIRVLGPWHDCQLNPVEYHQAPLRDRSEEAPPPPLVLSGRVAGRFHFGQSNKSAAALLAVLRPPTITPYLGEDGRQYSVIRRWPRSRADSSLKGLGS